MTRSLEAEHARLGRVVDLAPVGIVVVRGQDLAIEWFNATAARIFGLTDAQPPPLEEAFRGAGAEAVARACREAYRTNEQRVTPPFAAPRADAKQRYRCRVTPTHDANGHVDALVLYLEAVDGASR
jgi:PAS domain-containing protein